MGENMPNTATQEIEAIGAEVDITPEEQGNLYCLLFGRGDFTPTGLMARLVVTFMAEEESLSPMQVLAKMGHAKWNWYKWQQEQPGFLDWWNTVIEETIKDEHLARMYLSLFKRALTHDTGAAKLIAQRFDPKYTERSQQDIRGIFAGYEPTEAQNSRERQRKALASPQDAPQLTITALPIPEHPPEAQQGVGHVYAGLARAMQAQSHADTQHTEHEQPASNGTSLDFKPITPTEGAGGDCGGRDS